jgi:hypothetical protein
VERHENFTQGPVFSKGVTDEYQLWEEVLRQHGLDMEAGNHPVVSYGHDGQNALAPKMIWDKPVVYATQRQKNRDRVEQLMGLVDQGMSLYAAAKSLGMDASHAYRSAKRYHKITQGPMFSKGEEGR